MVSAEPSLRAILLLEPLRLVREGLRALLERSPDPPPVIEAATLEEAVGPSSDPSVVVTEADLPELGGRSPLEDLTARFPSAPVIVLAATGGPGEAAAALEAGALGYLLKTAGAEELDRAIREVAAGRTYVMPELDAEELGLPPPPPLSEREGQVLALLALGHTNREMARILSLAPRTVEKHRASIHTKLGVPNRAGLVRYALDRGLLRT